MLVKKIIMQAVEINTGDKVVKSNQIMRQDGEVGGTLMTSRWHWLKTIIQWFRDTSTKNIHFSTTLDSDPLPYQDEVRLIGGEHEDGHVLLCQWSDDGLGDLGDAHGLRAAGGIAIGDDVERQPDGAFHLQVLRGGKIWRRQGQGRCNCINKKKIIIIKNKKADAFNKLQGKTTSTSINHRADLIRWQSEQQLSS